MAFLSHKYIYYPLLLSLDILCRCVLISILRILSISWQNLKYWVWGEETGLFNFRCIVLCTSHKQVDT